MPNKSMLQRIAGGGLRIVALEVKNLWGIAEAVIRPGQRNIIRGANGTGKSSLLNAIQIALGGGSLGKYQRLGAEDPPEIVLEIAGPDDFIRVERDGDRPPKVLRRVGQSEALEKVPSPATFLKNLFDIKGANPFAFLAASDDDRAQLLIEALELEMDEELLEETLGEDVGFASSIPTELHPLVRLSLIRDAVYSARRGCNVDGESKRKAADQLRRSVPSERIADVSSEIERLNDSIQGASVALARREQQIEAQHLGEERDAREQFGKQKSELEREHERFAAELRAETERRIAENAETTRRAVEKLREAMEAEITMAQESASAELDKLETSRQKILDDKTRLAELRERQKESERHENTREQITEFERAASRHEADAKRLTSVLEGLESLKRKLAERLPIEGLDISGKEIKVNGIPWRDLNKGQQGTIAGIIAVERAKRSRLPVVFFDEAEHFDEAHIDAIARTVESAGGQLFAAVVAREGELSIEADGEKTGAVEVEAPEDPTVKDVR